MWYNTSCMFTLFDSAYPAAFVVGSALAVTGTVLQSVLRNPLAEPYLMGTVGGAALSAAGVTLLGLTAIGAWVLPSASFLGSCLSLALVCLVAYMAGRVRREESASPILRSSGSTLILAGFVTGGFTGSLNMLLLSYAPDRDFAAISKWLYGSLGSVTWLGLSIGAVAFAAVFLVLFFLSRQLDVLELGRSDAECLGVNARTIIFICLAASSLMTAVSVALAGAIGFVGLVVPHLVRRKAGPRMRRLLPLSAVVGGLFLVFAEWLRRFLPGDVPVGVVAAIFGSPFIFALLVSKKSGEGWDV